MPLERTLIPLEALFGHPARSATSISPDGALLSWIAPWCGAPNVWIADRDDPESARAATRIGGRGIKSYVWAEDDRHLLLIYDRDDAERTHILAVDIGTGAVRDLTQFEGVAARIARISPLVPGEILVAHNRRDARAHDLYRLDLASGTLAPHAISEGFVGFHVDRHFRVRLASRLAADGTRTILRRRRNGDYEPWQVFPPEDMRTSFARHLDADGDSLYLQDSRGRDTGALVRAPLEGGAATVVADNDRNDIGGLILDRNDLSPAAFEVRDLHLRRTALSDWIRCDLERLDSSGLGEWVLQGRDRSDRFWIIASNTDRAPPAAWLYDRSRDVLVRLHTGRPALTGRRFAPMTGAELTARDGRRLVCYLTRPDARLREAYSTPVGPTPLVIIVHGGPWCRDVFGFNAYHQWLADLGYAVLSVNFRGSTGFGKDFANAGDGEWNGRMIDDLADAVGWAVSRGFADPARVAIIGGSFGGHAALASLRRYPELYACAVDFMGPADLTSFVDNAPAWWDAGMAAVTRGIGTKGSPRGPAADQLTRPILVAHGKLDARVAQVDVEALVTRLRSAGTEVSFLVFEDEGHGLGRAENRITFHTAVRSFLHTHLAPDDAPP